MTAEHDMGTSIIAVEYKGGVVMGADSRTSTGNYVANRVSDKITAIHDKIFVCRSGSAADTQAISDFVTYYLDMHSTELGGLPLVNTAANLVQQMIYHNKDALLASMICAGWDSALGGQVYCIPLGGVRMRQPFAIGGSGSTYIYGWCDAEFKEGMNKEEALAFVRNALALAMARDGSSGGVIRTVVISEDKIEREMVPGDSLPRFLPEL
jgi:20S proteasome subunit beta 1